MSYVFSIDNDNADVAATSVSPSLNQSSTKCIDIDARQSCRRSVTQTYSSEINNNNDKFCRQSGDSLSEDFDDSSSCEKNVNKKKECRAELKRQNAIPRGILKYPDDWNARPNSSSVTSSLDSGDDLGYYGTSCESPVESRFMVRLIKNETTFGEPLVRKSVHWAEKDTVYVFRRGSSALACRKKNQKKSKKKKEKKIREEGEENKFSEKEDDDDDIDAIRVAIAGQRFSVEDYDSVSDVSSSSCDCSTSEASGDEVEPSSSTTTNEILNYTDENKNQGSSNKQKRKRQRKRNRHNKQSLRSHLETGGYDTD